MNHFSELRDDLLRRRPATVWINRLEYLAGQCGHTSYGYRVTFITKTDLASNGEASKV